MAHRLAHLSLNRSIERVPIAPRPIDTAGRLSVQFCSTFAAALCQQALHALVADVAVQVGQAGSFCWCLCRPLVCTLLGFKLG